MRSKVNGVTDTPEGLTTTSYALLGQLALRPWTVYEMTRNVARTLHWFWPRAESVLYQESRRLAERGLATTATEPGSRGRPRTVYTITPAGIAALRAWLSTAPAPVTLHFDAVLRVHLAPYGTKDDLERALSSARADAEALIRQAVLIGTEFVEGRNQFQSQVAVRAILFDYLWNFGLSTWMWADRSLSIVKSWPSVDPGSAAEQAAVSSISSKLEEWRDQSAALGGVTLGLRSDSGPVR